MNPVLTVALLAAAAYLVGAIPFGLLVGRWRGIDVRTVGSRNIGATNVGRQLGRPCGILVFVLDVLKGLVPTAVAGWVLIGLAQEANLADPVRYLCWLGTGAASVVGHNYPIYIGFRGGKGVSTSLGVALGVYPMLTIPALIAFGVWAVVVAVSRYVSLGSMAAGVAFPIAFLAVSSRRQPAGLSESWPLLVFAVLIGLLVLLRHRSNLRRLIAGTETRIGRPRDQTSMADHNP